jgi:hypothetical protein
MKEMKNLLYSRRLHPHRSALWKNLAAAAFPSADFFLPVLIHAAHSPDFSSRTLCSLPVLILPARHILLLSPSSPSTLLCRRPNF